jgi:son of sevenless-like protein
MYNTRNAASSSTTSSFQEHHQIEEQQLGELQQFNTSFCRALYDYDAQDPSALSFRRGDIIEILTQQPSGWWDGLLGDERGWFPSNYVVLISDEEAESAFAQAEIEAQATAVAQTQPHTALVNDPSFRGIQNEQQEWLDNELGKETRNHDPHDVTRNGGQSSDFWMPEVTPDGQVFPLLSHLFLSLREHTDILCEHTNWPTISISSSGS